MELQQFLASPLQKLEMRIAFADVLRLDPIAFRDQQEQARLLSREIDAALADGRLLHVKTTETDTERIVTLYKRV